MPRVKLTPKENYIYEYNHKVNIYDLNIAGHVGIPEITKILHIARRSMLNHLGFDEANLGEPFVGLLIADVALQMKKEMFLDDNLTIKITIDEMTNKSFRFFYLVMRNNEIAAIAETGAVAINYKKRALENIPEKFKNIFHETYSC